MTAVLLPIDVQDGASVKTASKNFEADEQSVKFKIDIENHTNQKLELLEKFEKSGEWGEIPQHVDPGKKESSIGHKYSGTATGKYLCQLAYRVCSSSHIKPEMHTLNCIFVSLFKFHI